MAPTGLYAQALCAIKLFWEKTLRRPWPAEVELVRADPPNRRHLAAIKVSVKYPG